MENLNILAIDIGHNVNYDIGASGIRNEDELNKSVGENLINLCTNAGIKVINCTPTCASSLKDSLNRRCSEANNNNADFFISLHHNAGGGHGAEALVYKEGKGLIVGNNILRNLNSLGFTNRGIKLRKDLAVLRCTKMPALLIECAFIDSVSDMNIYDSSKISQAIFTGICSSFNIVKNNNLYHTVVKGDTLYKISRQYNVSVQDIINNNSISNPDLITIGTKLIIK